MKSIKDALKGLITNDFRNVSLYERTPKSIEDMLNSGVHESNNMRMFPEVPNVKVNSIDETHDEVSLIWLDLEVKGIMSWRKGEFPKGQTTYSLVSFT